MKANRWIKLALIVTVVLTAGGLALMQPPQTANAAPEALCERHDVDVSLCIICNPDARDPNRLWCGGHERYEDRCFLCHPEIQDENRLYCTEHFLYEDECFYCHPELAPTQSATVKTVAEQPASSGERCAAHDALVSLCFICDPALRDPNRLWCGGHERYEDRCWLCHPDLEDPNRLWCSEHSLYEDECFLCHPELAPKTQTASVEPQQPSEPSKPGGLFCKEHNLYEIECAICHPELAPQLPAGSGLKVRLISSESADKAGVVVGKPEVGSTLSPVSVLSQVSYNMNAYARVTPLASGVVQQVFVDVGDAVQAGQALAELSSPDIAEAKSEYLSASADFDWKELNYKRERELHEKEINSQQDYERAKTELDIASAAVRRAYQQLLNFGFSNDDIMAIDQSKSASSSLLVRAAFSGTIVARQTVIGELANPGDELFAIADLSEMWLELSIPEDVIGYLNVGDPVTGSFDALPGAEVSGQVTWLASAIDLHNRFLKARSVVPNPSRQLKHGMFGQATIVPTGGAGFQVPADAVQRIDGHDYVFVKHEADLYELRKVSLGGRLDNAIKISAGLRSDDDVVVSRSHTLRSEMQKSKFGAGCVHD